MTYWRWEAAAVCLVKLHLLSRWLTGSLTRSVALASVARFEINVLWNGKEQPREHVHQICGLWDPRLHTTPLRLPSSPLNLKSVPESYLNNSQATLQKICTKNELVYSPRPQINQLALNYLWHIITIIIKYVTVASYWYWSFEDDHALWYWA